MCNYEVEVFLDIKKTEEWIYSPSFKRTDLSLTFCKNGTWIISFSLNKKKKIRREKNGVASQRIYKKTYLIINTGI